jgi:PAS domain S-box-containing protein
MKRGLAGNVAALTESSALLDAFPGESSVSALLRTHDWAASPLGPPSGWPEGLKVPLRMMLLSRFEMWLGWGPGLAFFYNDAYVPTLGVKHPASLSRPIRQVWPEIFEALEGRFNAVMRDGVATWDKALLLFLERSGYPEETYHTFSYSPLKGDDGAVGGLMCVVTEETERVISERRLDTLHTVATALLPVRTREDLLDGVRLALASNTRDFPFSLLRLFDGADDEGADPELAVDWPFAEVLQTAHSLRTPLEGLIDDPPCGAWDKPPTEALIVPVTKGDQTAPVGALVLGLNPYRPVDPDIGGFAELIAGQVAGALARVDARLSEVREMARLRELFEQSPSFVAILRGPNHRFELINPGYRQLTGHRDIVGMDIRDALPEIEGQGFFELLDTVYATGEPFVGQSVQATLHRTPGAPPETRFLDFVYQPMRDADGSVSGIFVEGIDVTSAHDAVAALKESEAQFRTLAEAMPDHVWTARPDGYLDWFNSGVYDYSGAQLGELDGAGWGHIVHPGDLPQAGMRWAAALSSGETYESEFRLRRADGVYRWHIARAVPLRGDDGVITRWIGTNTDIEDQKATAQALADLNITLEQQVQERTGELMATEEALRQSQKMEAVGQLTGGIAHDFNNLLAGITGSLDLLQTRLDQGRLEAIPRYMDAAQGAARRAAALTQRLLAFSRRQQLSPVPTDCNRLVAGLEDLIRRTVGPSVEMEVVGAGGLWSTLVDPNQLENALLNLCINARDAMPDGGRLTIETANKWLDDRAARDRELSPGQYISVCVTDTGTGMTADVVARAFDPFFTTKPLGRGTGLGLSMIYGFVRQSGGQVRIYSEVGQGTTMCLYLPRYVGDATDLEPSMRGAVADFGGHGETVLVVDDEPTVRMLILDVLSEAGYQALEAVDGPSGLRILEADARVDLLITDVGLPGGINGRQLADAGRAVRPGLKVLFITGYAENAVIGHGHLDPGMQVITKPFAIDSLGDKIRRMIDG